ncbi:MAG TPA: hypothetical protein VLR92_09165, partial [Blastocatellia bacterium]|nr:hypothetical protein [Blastocatellia bacterium]
YLDPWDAQQAIATARASVEKKEIDVKRWVAKIDVSARTPLIMDYGPTLEESIRTLEQTINLVSEKLELKADLLPSEIRDELSPVWGELDLAREVLLAAKGTVRTVPEVTNADFEREIKAACESLLNAMDPVSSSKTREKIAHRKANNEVGDSELEILRDELCNALDPSRRARQEARRRNEQEAANRANEDLVRDATDLARLRERLHSLLRS